MSHPPTAYESLHAYVDTLTVEEAMDLIDILNNWHDPDELTEEELAAVREGEEAIARGDYVTFEELTAELGTEIWGPPAPLLGRRPGHLGPEVPIEYLGPTPDL